MISVRRTLCHYRREKSITFSIKIQNNIFSKQQAILYGIRDVRMCIAFACYVYVHAYNASKKAIPSDTIPMPNGDVYGVKKKLVQNINIVQG